MRMTKQVQKSAVLIFFSTLILFSLGLSSQEVTAFDTRFYLFAQEMLRNGWSWFPTTYGDFYPDYPATSTWMIVALAKMFNGLSKAIAIFPTIFFAALTLTFTYLIGCLHRERIGWSAVFFLLLTLFFMRTIRSISLDMMIAGITTITFYLIHAHEVEAKSQRILWIYPLFILGFLIRGPIGLVMPVGVMCAYYAMTGQVKTMAKRGVIALFVLLVCMAALIVMAYLVGGKTFLQEVLRMQVFGRLESATLPRYFYFIDSFGSYALAYPIAMLVLVGIAFQWLRIRMVTSELRWVLLLASWSFIILIGMSVPADKKVRYILPMLPACALIAATFYTMEARWMTWFKKLLAVLFFILPTLFFAAICWVKYIDETKSLYLPVNYLPCLVFFLVMQMMQGLFWLKATEHEELLICLLEVAACSFVLFYLYVMEPIQLHIDQARDVVQTIERLRLHDHAKLIFYRETRDNLPIKYLINMPQAEKPLFISSLEELKQFQAPAYVVTSTTYANDIVTHLHHEYKEVMKAKLAHIDMIVFVRR
jgi:4-amino-4-deoxy-L-arabinose transferase-like glycosyltransferase